MLCLQITVDEGHIELVRKHGSGLAETIRGLVHSARYNFCINTTYSGI